MDTSDPKRFTRRYLSCAKIEFSPSEKIDLYREAAEEFMRTIFGMEPENYAITDESRISHFIPMDQPTEPVIRRIMDTYGIGLVPSNLATLFEELTNQVIEATGKFPPMWTIYDHPPDHPQHFVVRIFYGTVRTFGVELFDDLSAARKHVMRYGGSMPIQRS